MSKINTNAIHFNTNYIPGSTKIEKSGNGISFKSESANTMYTTSDGLVTSGNITISTKNLIITGNPSLNVSNVNIVVTSQANIGPLSNTNGNIVLTSNTLSTGNLIVNNTVYLRQGGWERISTNVATNTANITVSNLMSYNIIRITGMAINPVSNGTNFTFTLASSGVPNTALYSGTNAGMDHFDFIMWSVDWPSSGVTFQHPEYRAPQANSEWLSFELYVTQIGNTKQSSIWGTSLFGSNSSINTQLPSKISHMRGKHGYSAGYDSIVMSYSSGNIANATIFVDGLRYAPVSGGGVL